MLKLCAYTLSLRTQENKYLKLVGIKEFYNITGAKIISAVNCCVIVAVCASATFAVDSALDSNTVQAQPIETAAVSSVMESQIPDGSDTVETELVETTVEVTVTVISTPAPEESSIVSEHLETSATVTTENTTETTEETTAATTEATTTTTAETTEAITEKELYLAVYAKTTLNVRKGPGTEYDVVKNVYAGDQIDVIAITSNGWYKTYNGNYVKASLTTETKPTNTPTPKPKPTAKPTSSTTASTTKSTTEAQKEAPAGEGHTCTITFYGPQPRGDGTYSKSTATGTTCTEGRTCAADWSIYPAGTVIYIENDPLGGDGYYTVEDRGGGVKGYHIDIYAEDGESGNHSTCKRTVIAQ